MHRLRAGGGVGHWDWGFVGVLGCLGGRGPGSRWEGRLDWTESWAGTRA